MAYHANRPGHPDAPTWRSFVEKGELMEAFVNYLLRIPRMILLLSLVALACLPIALSNLVRDTSIALLLPVTLIGALLAMGLAKWRVRNLSSAIILLILGPLALFVRIGQLGGSIFELIKQTFVFLLALNDSLYQSSPLNPWSFVSASHDLTQRFLAFGSRLIAWTLGFWQGIRVEDPLIRIFMWSLSVWLLAAWAGWQISKNKRLLVGIVPVTIALAFILDYTGKDAWMLWLHLGLLILLYGMNSYAHVRDHWERSKIDYSDSTGLDTLFILVILTFSLVAISAFGSTVSIKDILDNLRARHASSNGARTESLGLQPGGGDPGVSGISGSISNSHLIGPGLELSDQLVMTVSTGDLPPMLPGASSSVQNYYWRTVTYEHYTGSGWNNPSPFVEDVPPEKTLIEPPYSNYRLVHQEVTFPNGTDGRVYWTGNLLSAEVPFQALWIRKAAENSILESDMLAALTPVDEYRVDSLLPNVSAQELRNSPSVYPDWVRNRFLSLPDSVPERVRTLGRDLSASGRTPYDRALAIQNYLRKFPYSLEVPAPPPGRDAADYFLFDLKKGYCDYYATTMAVLARAAGLPARIVIGYASGSYNNEQARYFVREDNAHAWVEIYFTGIGWVEFEPTASQPEIIYPGEDDSQAATPPVGPQVSVTSPLTRLLSHVLEVAWMPAIIMFLFVVVWSGWDALRLARLAPSQSIPILYKRLRRVARPVSGSASKDQTAHEYASALQTQISLIGMHSRLRNWLSPANDEIAQLTELYVCSLFAPRSPDRVEARAAMKAWSRLRLKLLLADCIAIKDQWSQIILKRRA